MKYIYIVGLEHSGTTLLNELFARRPQVLGLGEVGNFFSPKHMGAYIDRWGKEPDARLCSCGAAWERCSFWGEIIHLSGEYSDHVLADKYAELFDYTCKRFPQVRVIVDSSKSRYILEMLINNRNRFVLDEDALQILLAIKDIRSFTSSIQRKLHDHTLLRAIRTMNWWHGEISAFLSRFKTSDLTITIVSHEKLCDDPDRVIDGLVRRLGMDGKKCEPDTSEAGSHIVMGNKKFLVRNRNRIRYDMSWFTDDRINFAYLLHGKARRLNHRLYREAV